MENSSIISKTAGLRTLRRAGLHVTAGLGCAALIFFLPRSMAVVALAACAAAFMLLELARLYTLPLNRYVSAWFAPFEREREAGRLTGAIYLLLGCLLTAILFSKEIAMVAVVFVSLSDPAATLVGTWTGRVRFWGKSLEGHFACFAVCILCAAYLAGKPGYPTLTAAAAGAAFATVFQILPLKVNDNLTIPVGSALAMLGISYWLG